MFCFVLISLIFLLVVSVTKFCLNLESEMTTSPREPFRSYPWILVPIYVTQYWCGGLSIDINVLLKLVIIGCIVFHWNNYWPLYVGTLLYAPVDHFVWLAKCQHDFDHVGSNSLICLIYRPQNTPTSNERPDRPYKFHSWRLALHGWGHAPHIKFD